MLDIQPPLTCEFCSADLRIAYHKLTCRIVTNIEGIEGWLDIPKFLDRRKPKKAAEPEANVFD